MSVCHIALGGNIGDVASTFATSLERVSGPDLTVRSISRLYASAPMGAKAGGVYLNAAGEIDTSLSPLALLDRLQAVEDSFARDRSIRWGPRPLDLDLILFEGEIIDDPRLRVPHVASWYRRFVLDPLCDLVSGRTFPESGESVAQVRDRLMPRPLPIAISGDRDGSLAAAIEQSNDQIVIVEPDERCAFRVDIGGPTSIVTRTIGVPLESDPAESIRAIVTAAVCAPRAIEAPFWMRPNR